MFSLKPVAAEFVVYPNARPHKPAGAERVGVSDSLCAHVVDPKHRKNAKIADQASKPGPTSQPQWAEGYVHFNYFTVHLRTTCGHNIDYIRVGDAPPTSLLEVDVCVNPDLCL